MAVLTSPTWRHAVELFGTEAKATAWFQTALSELNNRTPEQVLLTDAQAVETVLDRIEYGVFA